MKSTLCAVILGLGLGLLGCDSNANRTTATDNRPAPPPPSSTAPSVSNPSGTISSPSTAQMNAADQALAQRVTSSLREDSSLAAVVPNMTVQANNGTVTLRGSVNNQQQRADVETKVRSVAGVTQVINDLDVASASR